MAELWDYAAVSFISSFNEGGGETWLMSSPLGSRAVPSVTLGLQTMGSHGWELVSVTVSTFIRGKDGELDTWFPKQYQAFFKKRRT